MFGVGVGCGDVGASLEDAPFAAAGENCFSIITRQTRH